MDTAKQDTQLKSTFLKKAKGSKRTHDEMSSVEIDFQNLNVGGDEQFKFNFSGADSATDDVLTENKVVKEDTTTSDVCVSENKPVTATPDQSTGLNYFKMNAGESFGFKFNFDRSSDT